jgi:hypothetical protein
MSTEKDNETKELLVKLVSERDKQVSADHKQRMERQREKEAKAQDSLSKFKETLTQSNINIDSLIAFEEQRNKGAKAEIAKLRASAMEPKGNPSSANSGSLLY